MQSAIPSGSSLVSALLSLTVLLALAPLIPGVAARTRALLTGRRGPPVWQLYADLAKLVRKGAVYSGTTTGMLQLTGPVVVGTTVLACTLVPLDVETVVESVKRTSKVLVLHEAILFGGMGGEIAARIADEAFEYLDAPVKRIGAKDTFVPFAGNLEAVVLPSVEDVVAGLSELLDY